MQAAGCGNAAHDIAGSIVALSWKISRRMMDASVGRGDGVVYGMFHKIKKYIRRFVNESAGKQRGYFFFIHPKT